MWVNASLPDILTSLFRTRFSLHRHPTQSCHGPVTAAIWPSILKRLWSANGNQTSGRACEKCLHSATNQSQNQKLCGNGPFRFTGSQLGRHLGRSSGYIFANVSHISTHPWKEKKKVNWFIHKGERVGGEHRSGHVRAVSAKIMWHLSCHCV